MNKIMESLFVEDKLNNSEYIIALSKLIEKTKDNKIVCIDGKWGTGKTFLLKQYEYIIDNLEEFNDNVKYSQHYNLFNSIKSNNLFFYYNAWKNDNHIDPFESIIYSILKSYPQYKDVIIDAGNVEDVMKDIIRLLTKTVSKNIGLDLDMESLNRLKTFEDLAKEIKLQEDKKENFTKLINKLLDDKRMILVIDELDRCSPNYAVKILETIKHFYNLNNITIIVSTNNLELVNIIKNIYGQDFDAYAYLDKIYDYIITIDSRRSMNYIEMFFDFDNILLPVNVFKSMVKKYSMTLRECDRYKTLYDIGRDSIENDYKIGHYNKNEQMILYKILIPIFYAFRIKDLYGYYEIIDGKTTKLIEALKDLKQYFIENEYNDWLKDVVYGNSSAQKSDEEVFQRIIDVFQKVYKDNWMKDSYFKLIKVSL